MKRYLLFCFDKYYPYGGWNDICGQFDSIEEALQNAHSDFYQIVDLHTDDGPTEVKSGKSLDTV